MASNRGHGGIQQLLTAEQEAQRIVNAAKNERYPRDEDYASDSDSDSITDDDFDFDVPPWLFQDLEDEDGSMIWQENNHLRIIFGSFGKDTDLDIVSAISLNPIKPEIEGGTIKIGQIICSLNTVKPQTKICGDALLSDPEVKDENKAEKIFTDENKSEKIYSDLGSKIANLLKKMFRLPNRLLALKNVLPASPYPDRASHTKSVFLAPDVIHHSRFKFRKLVSLSIDVPSPEKIVECIDLAFGCNDQITNQAMKLDYENVKSSLRLICRGVIDVPFSVGKEEEITPPTKTREEDELLFAVLWNLFSSPEPPWELLRRHGLQPLDASDTRVQEGVLLLAGLDPDVSLGQMFYLGSDLVFGPLFIGLHEQNNTSVQNFGPYHFRPSLVGPEDVWIIVVDWAIEYPP